MLLFNYLLTIRTQKALKNHQIHLPMCGTGNKSIICTATGFFLSQHRWYPSFCFHANLVFQEKTSNLCERCILKSVDLCTLVFPVCQCTKLYLIHEHFQHPIYAHFFVAAMLLNHFPSPYILLFLPCVLEAVAQD